MMPAVNGRIQISGLSVCRGQSSSIHRPVNLPIIFGDVFLAAEHWDYLSFHAFADNDNLKELKQNS